MFVFLCVLNSWNTICLFCNFVFNFNRKKNIIIEKKIYFILFYFWRLMDHLTIGDIVQNPVQRSM